MSSIISYEIWTAPASVRLLWDASLAAGATPVGSEALELQRIVSGVPTYGVDIRERDFPQETEQARALNFNKGCYVGQEIVERIRSRGAVHRKFTGFVAEGAAQIAAGMKIVAGDKEVGEITSSALLRFAGRTVALGYIRREVGSAGARSYDRDDAGGGGFPALRRRGAFGGERLSRSIERKKAFNRRDREGFAENAERGIRGRGLWLRRSTSNLALR